MDSLHLGIDIGGTNVKFGILNSEFEILHYDSGKLPKNLNQKDLFEWIVNHIQKHLNEFKEIETIGIGYPGVVNKAGQVLVSPNVPEFVGFNIKENLENILNRNIAVDNDANVAALAEHTIGNGIGLQNFVYITLGTGVGGALVLNGEVYKGANSGAGEIGHLILNPYDDLNENMPYRTGVLEEYLGKDAIIRTAKNLSRKFEKSPIVINSLFDVASISNYADEGDKLSIETMKLTGYYLGLGIISVANLLDISDFILGGGISNSSVIFYESALETAKRRVLPQLADRLSIRKAKYSEKAGIVGSAILGYRTQKKL